MSGKKVAVLSTVTTLSVFVAVVAVWGAVAMWFKMMSMQPPPMPPGPGANQKLMVKAAEIKVEALEEGEKYIARVEAIEHVSLEARIEGVIKEVHFKEGANVKKGDLLFSIEKDQYEAEVSLQKANVAKAQATLNKDVKYFNRLKSADSRSVSMTDIETAESVVAESKASLKQAEANLAIAELNLGYTDIYAPIDGKIGKNEFTLGNLVRPTSGVLVSIVQTDPVRVIFSPTDRSYLKAMKMIKSGFTNSMNINVSLADGTYIEEDGRWSFINNEMDADTGTIAVRAEFNNKDGLLVPGSYVKTFVTPSDSPSAPIVPQQAVMNDRKGYYVFVVNDKNSVEMRRITVGKKVDTGFVVVSNLEEGERVVVQGLQKVKPGMAVTVNLISE